jgi:hypothetical protein
MQSFSATELLRSVLGIHRPLRHSSADASCLAGLPMVCPQTGFGRFLIATSNGDCASSISSPFADRSLRCSLETGDGTAQADSSRFWKFLRSVLRFACVSLWECLKLDAPDKRDVLSRLGKLFGAMLLLKSRDRALPNSGSPKTIIRINNVRRNCMNRCHDFCQSSSVWRPSFGWPNSLLCKTFRERQECLNRLVAF